MARLAWIKLQGQKILFFNLLYFWVFKSLVWTEPSEVINLNITLWVNADIHAGRGCLGLIFLWERDSRCFDVSSSFVPLCILKRLPDIPSALVCGIHKTENIYCWKIAKLTHILMSYSSYTCIWESLLSVASALGLLSVGCKFKMLLLEKFESEELVHAVG